MPISPCIGTGRYGGDRGAILFATGLDNDVKLPSGFQLLGNYPNPFNARTTIRYSLPPHLGPDGQASPVTLDIYDILGRRVQTLYNGPQSPGRHSLIWNAEGFSSGVYFYKITAGEFEQTEKMMLVK